MAIAKSHPANGPQLQMDWNPLARWGMLTPRSSSAKPHGQMAADQNRTVSALGNRRFFVSSGWLGLRPSIDVVTVDSIGCDVHRGSLLVIVAHNHPAGVPRSQIQALHRLVVFPLQLPVQSNVLVDSEGFSSSVTSDQLKLGVS